MSQKRGQSRKRDTSAASSDILERILFYGVVLLVFALPLFIWPGISEYGYGKTIVALIGISALTILWGVSAWRKGSWTIRLPWITLPILGLIVASLASLLTATNGRVVVQSLVLVVFFALFLLLIAQSVRDRRDVNVLLFALLVSAFLAALYGLLQYLGVVRGPTGSSGGLSQIISTMGNRNYLGGFLAYLLLPAVVLVVRPRSRWVRIASILLIAFCFGMVLVVQQSGTVIALIVSAIVLIVGVAIFRPIEPIRRNRAWLLALIGTLVITFLIEAPSGPLNSVVGLSDDEPSAISTWWQRNVISVRTWDWWVGWEMFVDHPITGVGLGNYKLNFLPYKADFLASPRGASYNFYIDRAAQAHNEYVQLLAELGMLGTLALLALLAVLVTAIWRRLRANDEGGRFDLLLYACGIVGYGIHALVSFPAHLPASTLVLVVVGGLIWSRPYGDAGQFRVRLTGRILKISVAAIAVVGLVVSVFAGRDLSANLLMSKGLEQAQLGNVYGAEALFERSIVLDFAPRQTYYHLAMAQIERGAYDEAAENLERCFTRFVDEAVYFNYANLKANAGEYDDARETISLLLASHPRQETAVKARYVVAVIEAQTGNPLEATALLEQLAKDAPSFETAYIGLGTIYQARGMIDEARAAFQKALSLIERKLERAQETLTGQQTITAEGYGKLRTEIENYRQQREVVVGRLAELPSDGTP